MEPDNRARATRYNSHCALVIDDEPDILSLYELSLERVGVRVVAAEAVAFLGEKDKALAAVTAVVKEGNDYEALAAQNALDFMWKAGNITLAQAQKALKNLRIKKEPNDRIPNYLLSEKE